jgi:hypothetical protein
LTLAAKLAALDRQAALAIGTPQHFLDDFGHRLSVFFTLLFQSGGFAAFADVPPKP